MKISVTKITDKILMQIACSFTMNNRSRSNMTLKDIYKCEHSPMRTQIFCVDMRDIPTFVSVHLVRHSQTGQQHYVGSSRTDRGAKELADRNTPIDHMMILNAQHFIDMSKVRLCHKASEETRNAWALVIHELAKVDPDLAACCQPKCVRRKGCNELKTCGFWNKVAIHTKKEG